MTRQSRFTSRYIVTYDQAKSLVVIAVTDVLAMAQLISATYMDSCDADGTTDQFGRLVLTRITEIRVAL